MTGWFGFWSKVLDTLLGPPPPKRKRRPRPLGYVSNRDLFGQQNLKFGQQVAFKKKKSARPKVKKLHICKKDIL